VALRDGDPRRVLFDAAFSDGLSTPDQPSQRQVLFDVAFGRDSIDPNNPPGTLAGRAARTGANQLAAIWGGLVGAAGDVVESPGLKRYGADVYEKYSRYAAEKTQYVPSLEELLTDEGSFSDWMKWAGHHAVSGGVTTLPGAVAGLLTLVSGPVGWAGAGAVLYGMGVGDIYGAQQERQEDPDVRWALAGGIPYAVAERLFGVGAQAVKTLSKSQQKVLRDTLLEKVAESTVGKVGGGVAKGMAGEATAEGVQTVLTEGISRVDAGESVSEVLADPNFWMQVAEGAAAGAVAGGAFGGSIGAIDRMRGSRSADRAPESETGATDLGQPVTPETRTAAPVAPEAPIPEQEVFDPDQELPPSPLDEVGGVAGIAPGVAPAAPEVSRGTSPAAPEMPTAPRQPAVTPEGAGQHLPKDLVEEGLALMDGAETDQAFDESNAEVNALLEDAGFPRVGRRVNVTIPGLDPFQGVLATAAEVDGELELGIQREGGSIVYTSLSDRPTILPVPTPAQQEEMSATAAEREAAEAEEADAQAKWQQDYDLLVQRDDGLTPEESEAFGTRVAERMGADRDELTADPERRDQFLQMMTAEIDVESSKRQSDEKAREQAQKGLDKQVADEAKRRDDARKERETAEQDRIAENDARAIWNEDIQDDLEKFEDGGVPREEIEGIADRILEEMEVENFEAVAADPKRRTKFRQLLTRRAGREVRRRAKMAEEVSDGGKTAEKPTAKAGRDGAASAVSVRGRQESDQADRGGTSGSAEAAGQTGQDDDAAPATARGERVAGRDGSAADDDGTAEGPGAKRPGAASDAQAVGGNVEEAGQLGQTGTPKSEEEVRAGRDQAVGERIAAKTGEDIAYTPAGKAKATLPDYSVDVEYAVVEAADLVQSNLDDGAINPAYPQELQPRDRQRTESEKQVNRIATRTDPDQLGKAPVPQFGSPIIDRSGIVESGNARTMGLKRLYARAAAGDAKAQEAAKRYREYLENEGMDVAGQKEPVLVRIRRTDMTPTKRMKFVEDANVSVGASMSVAKRAMGDARAMRGIVNEYEGGDYAAQKNRKFVGRFIQEVVPETEQLQFATSDGELTEAGQQRIQAALLAAAYGDEKLVERLVEAKDQGRATVRRVLLEIAPEWLKVKESIEADEIDASADITKSILDAVHILQEGERRSAAGMRTAQAANHAWDQVLEWESPLIAEEKDALGVDSGVFEHTKAVLSFFYPEPESGRMRAGDKVIAAFKEYIAHVLSNTKAQADMFAEAAGGFSVESALKTTAVNARERDKSVNQRREEQYEADRAAGIRGTQDELREAGRLKESRTRQGEPIVRAVTDPVVARRIRQLIANMAPNVKVVLHDKPIPGQEGARGIFWPGGGSVADLIEVVMLSDDPVMTANHEVLHAVQPMLTSQEWETLRIAAEQGNWFEHYDIEKRYPSFYKDGEPNEKAYEEAIADAFADWSMSQPTAPWAAQKDAAPPPPPTGIFRKILNILRRIATVLRGRQHPVAPDEVFRRIRSGEVGRRPRRSRSGSVSYSRGDATPRGRYKFQSPEVQQQWDQSQQGVRHLQGSMLDRVKAGLKEFGQAFVRVYKHLPNVPRWAVARDSLRKVRGAPHASETRVVRYLDETLGGLSAADKELLTLKVVFDDLAWDVEQERTIPFFGDDHKAFKAEYARLNETMRSRSDLMQRVVKRQRFVRSIARDMVKHGLLTERQAANPVYFRHQVIEHAATKDLLEGTSSAGIRKRRVYKRGGTDKLINTVLVEVEASWMFNALNDIAAAKQIDVLHGEYGKTDALREAIKTHNEAAVAKGMALEENAPLQEELKVAKRSLAMGMRALSKAGLTKAQLPARFHDMLAQIGEKSAAPKPEFWDMIGWVSENLDGKPAEAALQVLSALGRQRSINQRAAGDDWIGPNDLDGALARLGGEFEGYTTWQFDKGNLFYTVQTVSQQVMNRYLDMTADDLVSEAAVNDLPIESLRAIVKSMRENRVMGGPKPQMVLPEELAATLDSFNAHSKGLIEKRARQTASFVKAWLLFNPLGALRYNITNTTGDLDGVIASGFGAKTTKFVAEATREIWAVNINRSKPSQQYQDALERSVHGSGFGKAEVLEQGKDIREFGRGQNVRSLMQEGWGKYGEGIPKNVAQLVGKGAALGTWRWTQRLTTVRENIFRFALYKAVLDKIAEVEKKHPDLTVAQQMALVGYGAANRADVNRLKDPRDRAALISRDTIGDYGNVTIATDWLRNYLMPFWSWNEINFKRYFRLVANTRGMLLETEERAALRRMGISTFGRFGVAAASIAATKILLYNGALHAWNHLMFPDEEDDLTESQKMTMHLILGSTDDSVISIRAPGALSDVLGWFGVIQAINMMGELERGRVGIGDVAEEIAYTPVNKLVNSVWPDYKIAAELLYGQSMYPDVRSPRPIEDPLRHYAARWNLQDFYDEVLGRPTRGLQKTAERALWIRREKGENAYYRIRSAAYDFKTRVTGTDMKISAKSPKTLAVKYWRRAVQYEDHDARPRMEAEMRRLGITRKERRRIVERQHPLAMLSRQQRRAFVKQLTRAERRSLRRAIAHYEELYLGK